MTTEMVQQVTSTYRLVATTVHNNDEAVLVARAGHPTILAVDIILSPFPSFNPIPILKLALSATVMFLFQVSITTWHRGTEPSQLHPIVRLIIILRLAIMLSPFHLTLHHRPILIGAMALLPFHPKEEWSIPIPVDLGLGYLVPRLAVQYHPPH